VSWKYKVGDRVRSGSGKIAKIVGHKTTRTGHYYECIPEVGPYAGRKLSKTKGLIEKHFTLEPAATSTASFPNIDLDEGTVTRLAEELKPLYRGQCDCGGHKCGYRDDELHGHARWCRLVEQSQGAKRC